VNERQLALQVQIAFDYFNERRFHDCYELLERIWRTSGGPERQLYQGIIQIAGACEKLLGGNWRGAVSLFDTGTVLIEPFAPTSHGIAVDRLLAATQACLTDLLRLGEARLGDFDLAKLPRIESASG
jgi:predicted metal-dependent hydrolase